MSINQHYELVGPLRAVDFVHLAEALYLRGPDANPAQYRWASVALEAMDHPWKTNCSTYDHFAKGMNSLDYVFSEGVFAAIPLTMAHHPGFGYIPFDTSLEHKKLKEYLFQLP